MDSSSIPSSAAQRLASALAQANAPAEMIDRARSGYYDELQSPLPQPLDVLAVELLQNHCNVLAKRVAQGEFNATPAEAIAYFAASGANVEYVGEDSPAYLELMGGADTLNTLYVNASFQQGDRPRVMWANKGFVGYLSLTQARSRAEEILLACAIATNEAAVFQGLNSIGRESVKGFGASADKQKQKHEAMAASAIDLIREFRPNLPDGLQPIFGSRSQQALVRFSAKWYGARLELDVDRAKEHAANLLQAAEASESDGFLYHFICTELELDIEAAYGMVRSLATYRDRNRLEELFDR